MVFHSHRSARAVPSTDYICKNRFLQSLQSRSKQGEKSMSYAVHSKTLFCVPKWWSTDQLYNVHENRLYKQRPLSRHLSGFTSPASYNTFPILLPPPSWSANRPVSSRLLLGFSRRAHQRTEAGNWHWTPRRDKSLFDHYRVGIGSPRPAVWVGAGGGARGWG